MVFLTWDEFSEGAEALFLRRPHHTRFVFKYKPRQCHFVLKVTDDRVVLQYRSNQTTQINRMLTLTQSMNQLMSTKKLAADMGAPGTWCTG